MLVSGSFAKIVGAGLLLKVSRSFVSDEGREGGASLKRHTQLTLLHLLTTAFERNIE